MGMVDTGLCKRRAALEEEHFLCEVMVDLNSQIAYYFSFELRFPVFYYEVHSQDCQ